MIQQLRRHPTLSAMLNPLLLSLSAGHLITDAYNNLLPMMYPVLMVRLGMTYTQIGLAAAMNVIVSSLSQPLFGHLADKIGGRHMAAAGVIWMGTILAALGFAWDYRAFVAILALAGLGTGAFHPQGAMNAAAVSNERRSTAAMSVFTLGGNVGYALGPVIGAVVFSTTLGLQGALFLWPPALAAAFWLYKAIGKVDVSRQAKKERALAKGVPVMHTQINFLAVLALIAVVMFRTWAASAVTNYVPLFYRSRGQPLAEASQILFLLLAFTAVGGVCGGLLADRFSGIRVTFVSLVLASPVLFLFFQTSGPLMALCAVVVGFMLGASTSVTVVLGQELMPGSLGMASGLVMGLGFVTGGIGVSLTGLAADHWGLFTALNTLAVLPLVGAVFCLGLRGPMRTVIGGSSGEL